MDKNRLLISFLAAILLFISCDNNRYITLGGYAQGGTYAVKINMKGVKVKPQEIQRKVDSLLLEIDNSLSGYNKSSLLSRMNAGEKIQANAMLSDIYGISYKIWEETDGVVDVASGPLFDAWGFGFTNDSLPDQNKIDAILDSCGMDRLPSDIEGAIEKEAVLNFNAIAQGYSCDIVADYLRSIGVEDMLVDIGEIYCSGLNPSRTGWTIAVDKPVDGNNTLGAEIKGVWKSDGRSCGIVTSGNYRKFYIKDGKKFSHSIDPRNGYPVEHNLLSATVIAPNATYADAYATYCMVVGLEEAKKFILSDENLEAYLIYDDNGQMETWHSAGFNISE